MNHFEELNLLDNRNWNNREKSRDCPLPKNNQVVSDNRRLDN